MKARYITPGLDSNLAVTQGENTYYYMSDGLGSVRNLVDASETVQNTYDYYAFGALLTETENVDSPYEFTGREREPGGLSHMHYYRNRYYMPGLGIFASRDAMWADVHRGWGYVGNMPTVYVDPWGLYDHRVEQKLREYYMGNPFPDLGRKYPDYSWELMQSVFGSMYGPNPSRLDAIKFSQQWEDYWGEKARGATRNIWCAEDWLGHDGMTRVGHPSRGNDPDWYLYVDPCTGNVSWIRKGSETEDQLKWRDNYINCKPPEDEADECPMGDYFGDGPPPHPYRDHS